MHHLHFQYLLFVLDLETEMRGDGIGQTSRIVDTGQGREYLRWDLHVQFDVLIEFGQHRTHQGLTFLVFHRLGLE